MTDSDRAPSPAFDQAHSGERGGINVEDREREAGLRGSRVSVNRWRSERGEKEKRAEGERTKVSQGHWMSMSRRRLF